MKKRGKLNLCFVLTWLFTFVSGASAQNTPKTIWWETYGGKDNDWAYSIHQTSDGGYIVAGWTWSFGAGLSDFYI